MRSLLCGLALLFNGAAIAAETDVPPSAYFSIEGLDTNVGNLKTMINRGCNSTAVNSLDKSTEAYLYRTIYLATRQLVHFENATKEKSESSADQHIKSAEEMSVRALNAIFQFADISLKNGCFELAEKYYRKIVSTFIGSNFTAARERAQTAIDQIGARPR